MNLMDPNNPTLLGVIVILSVTLAELVKIAITKRLNGRKSEGQWGLTPKEHEALLSIFTVVNKGDNDGVPLIYTKRSYEQIFEGIMEECRDNSAAQRTILEVLRRMESKVSLIPRTSWGGGKGE